MAILKSHQRQTILAVNRRRRARGLPPIPMPARLRGRFGARIPDAQEMLRRQHRIDDERVTLSPVITIGQDGVPEFEMGPPELSTSPPQHWYKRPGITGMPLGAEVAIGGTALLLLAYAWKSRK